MTSLGVGLWPHSGVPAAVAEPLFAHPLLKELLHLWPASGSNELLQALFPRSPVSGELELRSGAHVKALCPLGMGG